VSGSTNNIVVDEIQKMLNTFNILSAKKIIIHVDFPQTKLIEVFKPYVLLYLTERYSFTQLIKNKAYNKLNAKLFRFQKFNPQFGRRTIRTTVIQKKMFGKNSFKQQFEYIDTHINFNEKPKDNFLQDHTTISTDSLDYYIVPSALNTRFIFSNSQDMRLLLNENNIVDEDEDTDDGNEDDEEVIMPSPAENTEEEESIWTESYDDIDNDSMS
jgi:hypothetical protein